MSVSADAGVGLVPDTPIDMATYLDSNSGSKCVIMDTPGSVSDRIMIPAIDFADFMDVDESLCYTDVSREGPATRIDVAVRQLGCRMVQRLKNLIRVARSRGFVIVSFRCLRMLLEKGRGRWMTCRCRQGVVTIVWMDVFLGIR